MAELEPDAVVVVAVWPAVDSVWEEEELDDDSSAELSASSSCATVFRSLDTAVWAAAAWLSAALHVVGVTVPLVPLDGPPAPPVPPAPPPVPVIADVVGVDDPVDVGPVDVDPELAAQSVVAAVRAALAVVESESAWV